MRKIYSNILKVLQNSKYTDGIVGTFDRNIALLHPPTIK